MYDIEKMWVKFDEFGVKCWCPDNGKKCPPEANPECKLYLVKFIEIVNESDYDNEYSRINYNISRLEKDLIRKLKQESNKFKKELDKSINKFKIK